MALVGDVIVALRAAIPDPCLTLDPPVNLSAASASAAGGTLTPGQTFYIVATAINQWGETTATAETPQITIAGGNNAIAGSVILPAGATGGRAYYTLPNFTSGGEEQYVAINAAGNFTIVGTGSPGKPPQISSAYNPDTDGNFLTAAMVYAWLNDGLTKLAGAAGGIEDTTGIATVAQQLYYQIPGRWIRFNTARYDQWPIVMGDRDYIQYRYNVSGVVSLIANEAMSAILGTVFSAFPEPGSSSATTTLSVNMGVADTSLSCADASLFTPMSRIQVDNEIMMFSQVNAAGSPGYINGLIRGVAGTTPAAHSSGATVQELKFNFNGFRYSQLYVPGNAALQLDARHEWEVALRWFMLARAKEKEQSIQESSTLDQQFDAYCERLRKDQAYPITVSQIGGTLSRGRNVGRGRIIVN